MCTHGEALCDGDLYVEEQDSGPEAGTRSDWLLNITEHTAHTRGEIIDRVDKTLGPPALSMTLPDQVNPGESCDPLLMSLVKSTSISVEEGEETG